MENQRVAGGIKICLDTEKKLNAEGAEAARKTRRKPSEKREKELEGESDAAANGAG